MVRSTAPEVVRVLNAVQHDEQRRLAALPGDLEQVVKRRVAARRGESDRPLVGLPTGDRIEPGPVGPLHGYLAPARAISMMAVRRLPAVCSTTIRLILRPARRASLTALTPTYHLGMPALYENAAGRSIGGKNDELPCR